MASPADYDAARKAIEAAGFFTSPETFDGVVDRIVCASKRDEFGFSGVSFWISKRDDGWRIGAWGGVVYTVPATTSIEAVAIDILGSHRGTPVDFDLPLKLKHSLREVR